MLLTACIGNKPGAESIMNDSITADSLIDVEPFSTFITKFNKDSLFAMTRIADEVSSTDYNGWDMDTLCNVEGVNMKYSKREMRDIWHNINHTRDYNEEYEVKYEIRNDTATECLYVPNSGLWTDIIFTLRNKKWYLTNLNDYTF